MKNTSKQLKMIEHIWFQEKSMINIKIMLDFAKLIKNDFVPRFV